MGSFTSGVADGMLANRAGAAESAASWSSAAASNAESRARSSDSRARSAESAADIFKIQMMDWREKAFAIRAHLVKQTGVASAGCVVMNAVAKAMDEMDPAQREKFRDRFVQLARARMQEIDREQRGSKEPLLVEDRMRELNVNKILGIV